MVNICFFNGGVNQKIHFHGRGPKNFELWGRPTQLSFGCSRCHSLGPNEGTPYRIQGSLLVLFGGMRLRQVFGRRSDEFEALVAVCGRAKLS